jgi:M6 family metalloprotease-like protein/uncharacterized repeat protein (TIGR01451 family)
MSSLPRTTLLLACAALLVYAGALADAGRAVSGAPEATSGPSAFCTTAQKRQATKRLASFKKSMAARRRAYFKRVRNRKTRAVFVKNQRRTLKKLTTNAACRVRRPAPRSPAPQPSPVPQPPPNPRAAADLAVSLTPGEASAFIHEPATFTVEVRNRGTVAAPDVVLVDALPRTLRRVAAGQCAGLTTIRCELGALGPGGSRTVELRLRPLATGSLPHAVSVSSAAVEGNPADNSASATLSVSALPTYATPPDPGFSFQLARPSFANDRGAPSPFVGEWPKTPGEYHPGTGTLRGAVIFVDFAEAPGSQSLSMEESLDLLEIDSAAWYREVSYGRLSLELESAGGWYRMAKPAAEYGIAQCCSQPNIRAFVTEAIAQADPHFDFSNTDAVWVIAASGASEQIRILVDQRWPGEGIVVDGRELRRWITGAASYPSVPTQVEPARYAAWIATHEIGHFLGLPDLYLKPPGCPPCPNSFEPVGYWDMMSETPLLAHFLAWHKWLLGWLDPPQLRGLTSPGSLETALTPLAAPGGVKAVVVPQSASKAYVVEARVPLGWERGLCDRGVLVYTVDSSKRNVEGPVQIFPAHGATSSSTCGPIADAAFDLGPGEVPTFEDAAVRVEVLEAAADGTYRVRVTKK